MLYQPVDSVGNRIRKAMEITGIRQCELVEKTGISKSLINHYLTGKVKDAKTDKIVALAKALNVSEVWLMGMDVPMERTPVKKAEPKTDQDSVPSMPKPTILPKDGLPQKPITPGMMRKPNPNPNMIRKPIPSKPVSEYEINNDFVEVMDIYSKLDDNKKKLFMSYLRWLTNN